MTGGGALSLSADLSDMALPVRGLRFTVEVSTDALLSLFEVELSEEAVERRDI